MKSKVIELRCPEGTRDALTEMLREGAQKLIMQAVEAEFRGFLEGQAELILEDGRRRVVRNGYLPEREVQTGIGSVVVKVPEREIEAMGG